MKRKSPTADERAIVRQALESWIALDSYVANGSYRLKSSRRKVTSWNKTVKKFFPGSEYLSLAATYFRNEGLVVIPIVLQHDNVRIVKFSAAHWVVALSNISEKQALDTDKYWPQVHRYAATAIKAALVNDSQFADHPIWTVDPAVEAVTTAAA
jgi:hypothetical protein